MSLKSQIQNPPLSNYKAELIKILMTVTQEKVT